MARQRVVVGLPTTLSIHFHTSRLLRSVYGFLYTKQRSIYLPTEATLLQLSKKKREEGNIWDFLLALDKSML